MSWKTITPSPRSALGIHRGRLTPMFRVGISGPWKKKDGVELPKRLSFRIPGEVLEAAGLRHQDVVEILLGEGEHAGKACLQRTEGQGWRISKVSKSNIGTLNARLTMEELDAFVPEGKKYAYDFDELECGPGYIIWKIPEPAQQTSGFRAVGSK